jgi:hypothetical protein
MRRTWLIAGALVAATALTGCGGTSPVVILNTEKVERAIQQSIVRERGLESNVSCPSGVHQVRGVTFICTAQLQHGTTPFVVKQVDGRGDVTYVGR